eukprot:12341190-Alexandrium_andersonii.AAC.1
MGSALWDGDVVNCPRSIPHRPFSAAVCSALRKATAQRQMWGASSHMFVAPWPCEARKTGSAEGA